MGTVRDGIDYCLQSFLRCSVATASTMVVTMPTGLSGFCLRHALCKAKQGHETALTTCFSPKQEEKVTLWHNLAPPLAEKPGVTWMGVANLAFGEEEGVICVGLIQGLHAFLPPLNLLFTEGQGQARQSARGAVCPAASQHFLGCRDIWWHFSSLCRQCIHPYSEVIATLSLMPEPSLFPVILLKKKKKYHPLPFLNSLCSEKTSEQIWRVHPHIPAV